MFKYGLMDISLLVLKKEIYSCSNVVNMNVKDMIIKQEEIMSSLLDKIKKLKLNDVEFKFVTKNLNVKNC